MSNEIDIPDVVGAVNESGYAVLPNVVDTGLLNRIEAEVARIASVETYAKPDVDGDAAVRGSASHRIRNLISRAGVFREAALSDPVAGIVEQLLQPGYLLFSSAINDVGPSETRQRLHTDDMLISLPRPLAAPVIVNTIWALSDFTDQNGATRVVPGSHKCASPPSEDAAIPIEMPRGSVLIYHGSLWHQAGANATQSDRRAGMILAYCARFIRPYENQMKLIPLEDARAMSAAERQLIGFDYVIQDLLRQ